jgi:hypothetical protein
MVKIFQEENNLIKALQFQPWQHFKILSFHYVMQLF